MNTENKKLVLLIPGFAADESDSTCLPSQQALVLALKRDFPSLNIIVIAFQYPFRSGQYDWHGIPIIALNGKNKGGISGVIVWIRAWRTLGRLNKDGGILGILSFWCTECGLVGKWFGKFAKVKHLCWVLGRDARKENGYVKFTRPKSTELVAMSEFLVNAFHANHGVKPFAIVPNAIDPQSFPPLHPGRTIDVIGVGSLIPLKQYELFISAISKSVERFPTLKAIICGDGPQRENLQDFINKSRLKENVQLLGEKSHPHVLELMQESKILLHPSSYEGHSGVCIEALYAGAHVISFRSPTEKPMEHWHVVNTFDEMVSKLIELLSYKGLEHNRIEVLTAGQSVAMIMELFDYRETAARYS